MRPDGGLRPARSIVLVGAAVATITSLFGGVFSIGALLFAIWAFVPYAVLLIAEPRLSSWMVGGAGLAALAVDIGIRAAVFLFPTGSTAAIALVFAPMWIVVIAIPVGGAIGLVVGRAWRAGGTAVRAVLGVVVALLFSVVVMGFARPDLMPQNVAARRNALAALGDPRIVVGGDSLTITPISDRSVSYQAGDFDDRPGDEIAMVTHDGVELVSAGDLSSRRSIRFGGAKGWLWGPFSRLVRIGDNLRVVQTGGGFSDVELRAFDNTVLWAYHPDPTLAPSAMLPADLDGDGAIEFYASSTRAVARLNASGATVWTRETSLVDLNAVAPATARDAGLLVGGSYQQHVLGWNAAGDRVVDLPWPGNTIVAIADWPDRRTLIVGGDAPRAIALDGTPAGTIDMGGYVSVNQAVSFAWHRGGPPLLAVAGYAPRDVNRSRVRIYDASSHIVFDEVLADGVALSVAYDDEGRAMLLISSHGLRGISARRR